MKVQSFLPSEIVAYLDRYVVGQTKAKRSIAVALRDRYRLSCVKDQALKAEIKPKNMMFMGPTGVGKTELAVRISELYNFPFLKLESTKFTEVGYVGKDVESAIVDLVEITVNKLNAKAEKRKLKTSEIEDIILEAVMNGEDNSTPAVSEVVQLEKIRSGELDGEVVTVDIPEDSSDGSSNKMNFEIPSGGIVGILPLSDIMNNMSKSTQKTCTIKEAREILANCKVNCSSSEEIAKEAISLVENYGIIFIDEIDKLISPRNHNTRGEVSREGVQRDLLSLVEGTIVRTKYGLVKTNHILFISAGSFHNAHVSDLLPELQGRFPIQIKLESLTVDDFIKILTVPEYNLLKQIISLLGVDKIEAKFTEDGIHTIAALTHRLNMEFENTGARRLYTILQAIIEEISFSATESVIEINSKYIEEKTYDLTKDLKHKKENYLL